MGIRGVVEGVRKEIHSKELPSLLVIFVNPHPPRFGLGFPTPFNVFNTQAGSDWPGRGRKNKIPIYLIFYPLEGDYIHSSVQPQYLFTLKLCQTCPMHYSKAVPKVTRQSGNCPTPTLLETNMETQKGPYKDYSPSKMGLNGFPC